MIHWDWIWTATIAVPLASFGGSVVSAVWYPLKIKTLEAEVSLERARRERILIERAK